MLSPPLEHKLFKDKISFTFFLTPPRTVFGTQQIFKKCSLIDQLNEWLLNALHCPF